MRFFFFLFLKYPLGWIGIKLILEMSNYLLFGKVPILQVVFLFVCLLFILDFPVYPPSYSYQRYDSETWIHIQ